MNASGAPRSAYADDDFVIIRGEAVRALGDYQSAGVFQRIAWRCERTGEWRATVARIAAEVWLTEKQVRRAVAHLRDAGWITGRKSHPMDNTLTWRVTWADSTIRPSGHIDRPQGRMDPPCGADIPIRKTETLTEETTTGSATPTAHVAASRLDVLGVALSDADCDHIDPMQAWDAMTADGIRHPDHFASALDAHALEGYIDGLGVDL